ALAPPTPQERLPVGWASRKRDAWAQERGSAASCAVVSRFRDPAPTGSNATSGPQEGVLVGWGSRCGQVKEVSGAVGGSSGRSGGAAGRSVGASGPGSWGRQTERGGAATATPPWWTSGPGSTPGGGGTAASRASPRR